MQERNILVVGIFAITDSRSCGLRMQVGLLLIPGH